MDGRGCGLHGGGGRGGRGRGEGEGEGLGSGSGSGPQHGMITLEDLESFSEDQLSDSGTGSVEERELMDDEDQNRLLSYWQDIARGHRIEVPREKHLHMHKTSNLKVDGLRQPKTTPGSTPVSKKQDSEAIMGTGSRKLDSSQDWKPTLSSAVVAHPPQDMAEPIQQLTTNNNGTHRRETVPFTLISRKEKCGDVLYEKRHYDKAHWACITVNDDTYEQSIGYGFMKIMRYICQQNSLGIYLGMTIPILTVVRTEEAIMSLSRAVTVAYYLPSNHQTPPPQPLDPDIVIEEWPATIVYTRAFTGATNETTIMSQINTLAEILDSPGLYVTNSFIVAGYTNPAAAHRVNEIWFIQRQ